MAPSLFVQFLLTLAANSVGRRLLLERSRVALAGALLCQSDGGHSAARAVEYPRTLTIPLTDCGGSYCAVYRVAGTPFRAVVDTGSPFLAVAGSCTKRWGCFQGEGGAAELEDTWETFDGREGPVVWRRGSLAFGDSRLADDAIFGVLSDQLVGRPGGVFLGLVKYTRSGIRPSFLGQTPFKAFRMDLRTAEPKLVLSTVPMIPVDARWLRMVDLRPFGSPVEHYAARVRALRVNGRELRLADRKPIIAIFDTGTTGLAISPSLWEASMTSYLDGNGAPWTSVVDVEMATERGGAPVALSVDRPFPTTPIQQIPWPKFDGHLIVLGLSFLQGRELTVDVDKRRMWLGYDR